MGNVKKLLYDYSLSFVLTHVTQLDHLLCSAIVESFISPGLKETYSMG